MRRSGGDELPDDLGEPRGLVERDEGVAVLDLDGAAVEVAGEAPAVVGGHDAILAGPDDEGGPAEGGQALGGGQENASVRYRSAQHGLSLIHIGRWRRNAES